MNAEVQVKALETALLARARELMREHLEKAEGEKARILREVAQELRGAEEREILRAKMDADRLMRRRVQAAEIRMQGELDRLRWTLVQAIVGDVRARLARLAADDPAYGSILGALLAAAAERLEGHALVAELNARDRERYAARWEQLAAEAVPGKHIALGAAVHAASGGVIVRTPNNHVRIDNTFDGRLDRLADAVHAAVLERLFAAVPHMETLFHG
jgi:V/A-type H+-transporting ATPase subunit E